MLTLRSVREAYVAKGTVRERKTWATKSLIILELHRLFRDNNINIILILGWIL